MRGIAYDLARSALFRMDAEAAHQLTLGLLARGAATPLRCAWRNARVADPVTLAGLPFPNRIGLAAGLDKNATAIDGLAQMGFGFIEVGTVTPRPQPGNPKPRMFRLPQAQALINRMGFNNDGLAAFIGHVKASRFYADAHGNVATSRPLLGLNIGKNATTPIAEAAKDYLFGLTGVYPYADYVTINISSPNTKNLRTLQADAALNDLLSALKDCQAKLAFEHRRYVPLFVKIAPDLDGEQIQVIAQALRAHEIEGVIATNTTLAREAVRTLPHGNETGGLSGAPLRDASNRVIRELRAALGPGFPIIGVGGIFSGADALAKIEAGADVVQIFTGLIYRGPALVDEIARALASAPAGSRPKAATASAADSEQS